MKLKTKLVASIMSVCLVCAVFAIGVFALKTANLKIGGDVSFVATGVNAEIKNAKLTNGTTITNLSDVSISTAKTQSEIDAQMQDWTTLQIDFDEKATEIVLSFDIANTSVGNSYIEIETSHSFSNEKANVDILPDALNINYLQSKENLNDENIFHNFKLRFVVINDELNVPDNTTFNLNIALSHKDCHELQNLSLDGVKYEITSEKTARVAAYEDENVNYPNRIDLVIPPVVENSGKQYIVTEIKNCAFVQMDNMGNTFGTDDLFSITIPGTVKNIGDSAFLECTKLSSLTLKEGIQTIGELAFRDCSIVELKIPKSITSIASNAFSSEYNSNFLSKIIVDHGNEVYDSRNDCNAIIETATNTLIVGSSNSTIPKDVTSIEDSAFHRCTNMKTIKVEQGNEVYDSRNDCNAIIETATNTLIVGSGNTVIPKDVTKIDDRAFWDRKRLNTITIPKSVTSIGTNAFNRCDNLVEINNLSDIEITQSSFGLSNSDINIITPNNGKESLISYVDDYVFYDYGGTKFLVGHKGHKTEIIQPSINSSFKIRSWAFSNSPELTSITISSGVAGIESYAFAGCAMLSEINYCSNKAPSLLNNIFRDSGSNSAEIIVNIEDGVEEFPFDLLSGDPFNNDSLQELIINIGKNVTEIPVSSFSNVKSLTSITIPDSVTSIGMHAFDGCTNLESVTLSKNLTTIAIYAFQNCTSLTSITIPDGVTNIGSSAFDGCTNLESVTLGNGIDTIENYTFRNCASLKEIQIPNKVISIGANAFNGCSALEKLILNEGLQKTGKNALKGCTSLKELVIPSSMTVIAQDTFNGCTGLESVKFANPNGWFLASSTSATTGTAVQLTEQASKENADLLLANIKKVWKRS